MTNILLLPKFAPTTTFAVARNGDWLDTIVFSSPGSPPAPLTLTGAIVAASNLVTVTTSIAGVVPGQPIAQVPGIPAGAFVGAIPTPTTLTMVDSIGVALNATATNAEAQLVFQPLPLDLTGITFVAKVRESVASSDVVLVASTDDGTFINSGTAGTLAFRILQPAMDKLVAVDHVIDIVATADGHTISLFPEGPATVAVAEGVTNIQ